MIIEEWDLRHWKNRQLDLFRWNEVSEFTVDIPIVNKRANLDNFHKIIMEGNPMIPREIIDSMAAKIADEIDREIYEEYTGRIDEIHIASRYRMGDRSRV